MHINLHMYMYKHVYMYMYMYLYMQVACTWLRNNRYKYGYAIMRGCMHRIAYVQIMYM